MINLFFSSLIIAFGIFFSSCKEIPPNIDFTSIPSSGDTTSVPFDTSLASQKRNVLIEDFTGVKCVNCPSAHVVATSILNSYPKGRVVVVVEHDMGGLLVDPYSFGHYDFRTVEAKDIVAVVGPISSKPIGSIDRKFFTGETNRAVVRQKWGGYVTKQYADSIPTVQMKIENSYNDANRLLSLSVILQYPQTITSDLKMSVMLTESGIKEPQFGGPNAGPTGVDTFYVHNHVLRDMMTPSLGRVVIGNKTPGIATKFLFPDFNIPASWNADNCHIVAFVTEGTDSVLQVIETKLKK